MAALLGRSLSSLLPAWRRGNGWNSHPVVHV